MPWVESALRAGWFYQFMKRLLPVVLLAGVMVGLIIHFRRPPTLTEPPATVTTATPAEAAAHPFPLLPAASGGLPSPAKHPASLSDEISRALRSGSTAARDRAFNALLPELIAQNAPEAGRLAEAWESGPLRDELIRQITRHWSAADIGAAVAWLAGLETGDQGHAVQAATAQVAQTDPAGAIELAQAFHLGTGDGSLEHLAQLWAEEKPREAVAWIISQPAGLPRDRLLARIAHVRAQQDAVEASRLVLNHMTPGDARDAALLAVVRLWAVRDPAGAATWVGQFPPGPLHTRALTELETARKLR